MRRGRDVRKSLPTFLILDCGSLVGDWWRFTTQSFWQQKSWRFSKATCVISGWHLTPLKPNVMITLKIRNDPHGTEVVLATKIYHLFLAFRRRSVCVPFGDSRSIDQSSFAALSVSLLPAVEAGTTYAEIPAGFGNVANLLGIPQYPQFAFKFALILVHKHLLLAKTGRLKKMSRE